MSNLFKSVSKNISKDLDNLLTAPMGKPDYAVPPSTTGVRACAFAPSEGQYNHRSLFAASESKFDSLTRRQLQDLAKDKVNVLPGVKGNSTSKAIIAALEKQAGSSSSSSSYNNPIATTTTSPSTRWSSTPLSIPHDLQKKVNLASEKGVGGERLQRKAGGGMNDSDIKKFLKEHYVVPGKNTAANRILLNQFIKAPTHLPFGIPPVPNIPPVPTNHQFSDQQLAQQAKLAQQKAEIARRRESEKERATEERRKAFMATTYAQLYAQLSTIWDEKVAYGIDNEDYIDSMKKSDTVAKAEAGWLGYGLNKVNKKSTMFIHLKKIHDIIRRINDQTFNDTYAEFKSEVFGLDGFNKKPCSYSSGINLASIANWDFYCTDRGGINNDYVIEYIDSAVFVCDLLGAETGQNTQKLADRTKKAQLAEQQAELERQQVIKQAELAEQQAKQQAELERQQRMAIEEQAAKQQAEIALQRRMADERLQEQKRKEEYKEAAEAAIKAAKMEAKAEKKAKRKAEKEALAEREAKIKAEKKAKRKAERKAERKWLVEGKKIEEFIQRYKEEITNIKAILKNKGLELDDETRELRQEQQEELEEEIDELQERITKKQPLDNAYEDLLLSDDSADDDSDDDNSGETKSDGDDSDDDDGGFAKSEGLFDSLQKKINLASEKGGSNSKSRGGMNGPSIAAFLESKGLKDVKKATTKKNRKLLNQYRVAIDDEPTLEEIKKTIEGKYKSQGGLNRDKVRAFLEHHGLKPEKSLKKMRSQLAALLPKLE